MSPPLKLIPGGYCVSSSTETCLFWTERCVSSVSELLLFYYCWFYSPDTGFTCFFFSTAQGPVDEKPDDHRRRPQVQADLRPGNLLTGDPKTR